MQLKRHHFLNQTTALNNLENNETNICSPVDCVLSFICTCYPTQRCEIGQELTSL